MVNHGKLYTYQKHGCRCLECRAANAAKAREWRAENHELSKAYQRAWNQGRRWKVLQHYGGKCFCCGEATLEFLSLDHKNGGGTKHRQALGLRGSGIWAWVKRQGFPDLFRVACHNCNQAIGYYGRCPHQGPTEV